LHKNKTVEQKGGNAPIIGAAVIGAGVIGTLGIYHTLSSKYGSSHQSNRTGPQNANAHIRTYKKNVTAKANGSGKEENNNEIT
jgi:hypothetical protein